MMKITARAGLAAALIGLLSVPAMSQEEVKGPLKRVQGKWNFALPDGGSGTWEVTGDKVTVAMPDGPRYEAKATVDREVKPIAFDFEITGGEADAVGQTVKGIFQMKAGKPIFCVAAPGMDRPEEFKADEASDVYLFELTRADGEEPAEDPDAPEGDLKRMQGAWKTELPDNGGEIHYQFKGSNLVVEAPNRRYEITVTLDPEAKPHKAVDFHVDEGPEESKGQTNQAIYRIEEGKLIICIDGGAGSRPAEFETEQGQSYILELSRIQKDQE